MKVYIAGKVSGLTPEEFHKKFDDCRYEVEKHVNGVILCPTDLCEDDWDWDKCMNVCIPQILTSDLVVMMSDWKDSKGAVIEHTIAQTQHIPIWYM